MRPGLISTQVHSAEELEALVTKCLSYRRVSITARNAQSSRSHAILNIRIKNLLLPTVDEGEIILVE